MRMLEELRSLIKIVGGELKIKLKKQLKMLSLALIILLLGGFLNALVMCSNQGKMPVNKEKLYMAKETPSVKELKEKGETKRHVIENESTKFKVLDDRIILPFVNGILSIGDILMTIGVPLLIYVAFWGYIVIVKEQK